VVIAPVSLTSQALKDLRQAAPRALYDSRAQTVSLPAPSAPSERVEVANGLLRVLAELAEPAPA
jgi:hypothetical protein